MIAVVDYGVGNIHSVTSSFLVCGAKVQLTNSPLVLAKADGIVLPGVGKFGFAVQKLKERGLFDVIKREALLGKPLLGICLGMQLLFKDSQESPEAEGLGLIEGSVTRLNAHNLKIPHMGWTSLNGGGGDMPLERDAFYYFVHSYGCHALQRQYSVATATYGESFDAAVQKEHIWGCQFHPEKSGIKGQEIIKQFILFAEGKKV